MKKPKIAVFRALRLGDMICATPAFRALRLAYPHAEITLIGLPWADQFAKRLNQYIDTFIAFPGFHGLAEQPFDQSAFSAFLETVRKRKFDLVIQLHGNGIITNPLVSQFGGKLVAGCYTSGASRKHVNIAVRYSDAHPEIYRTLSVVRATGIPPCGNHLEFPITDAELHELETLPEHISLKYKPYICMHPGAHSSDRRWHPKNFAYIANELSSQGYQVVITGVKEEENTIREMIEHMNHAPINTAGRLSIGATAALLKSSKLVVSNCTSISHIADALNVPSVVIFQTSDLRRWAPLNRTIHRPVAQAQAKDTAYVLSEAMRLLEKRNTIASFTLNDQLQAYGGAYGA